uniref:Uncharacterized protein n=1 Tax=Salarias fasciatus TaxID=181472 RepID=A0A672JE40_SALFA
SVDMVLAGSSDSTRVVRERLVCRGIIGQQGTLEKIMSVDVVCHFVAPLLSISPKQLNFRVKGQNLPLVYKKLVLNNVSSLSLSMELTLAEPFYLCEASGEQSSTTTKSLLLGDKSQVELWVCFNPDFYQDQMSRIVDEVLENHLGHPQEDVVALHAEVHYPNLHFSSTEVDFGCVVNCTETCREITITNCSQLPVSYRWAFMDGHKQRPHGFYVLSESIQTTHLIYCFSSCKQIFDILPMYGDLQPGERQQVTFSFYGHENISKDMVAQCRVDDGPTYELKLRGEASEISYRLQPTRLDFGLLFPEQLLVDLLAERFQLGDCHHGLIVDGLDSTFTPSAANTLQVVLKALNNRKHIYVVHLADSYQALKARERAQKEAGARSSWEKRGLDTLSFCL